MFALASFLYKSCTLSFILTAPRIYRSFGCGINIGYKSVNELDQDIVDGTIEEETIEVDNKNAFGVTLGCNPKVGHCLYQMFK